MYLVTTILLASICGAQTGAPAMQLNRDPDTARSRPPTSPSSGKPMMPG